MFSGNNSYGLVNHTAEYNFTYNKYYPYANASEFTVQMVVHPTGPTVGRTQVLAAKQGEWKLQLNADGVVEWQAFSPTPYLTTNLPDRTVFGRILWA
jgi:hypothetical protein